MVLLNIIYNSTIKIESDYFIKHISIYELIWLFVYDDIFNTSFDRSLWDEIVQHFLYNLH